MTYILVLISVVTLDLITKEMAERFLHSKVYDPLPFLKLSLVYNRGAAFGLLADLPDWIRLPVLILTPIIAFVITYLYSSRDGSTYIAVAMGLIGGGAMGNLYDRIFLGKVRDFVHLHAGDLYWPAFNLADASITVAVLMIILRTLRRDG
ncbi:MAG: signal peptidase II [Aquificota bacterium]|nr:signal peptidase II [Aquificota bacterium]